MPRKFTFTTQVYDEKTDFPTTGDVDVIYIDASTNIAYRYDESYYQISSTEVNIWGALGSVSKGGGGGGGGATWGSITGTLSSQTDLQTALDSKQDDLVSGTNIKTINGSSVLGSGDLPVGGGIHLQRNTISGGYVNLFITYQGFTTQASNANRLILEPFIPNQTLTIQSLNINVTTLFATGLAKVLIYSDVSGVPTNKLYESTDLDCSTTGIKTATTTFTFNAGTTYWLGFVSNNSTNAFTYYGQSSILSFAGGAFSNATHGYFNATYASIPSTLTTVIYSSGNIPAITLRKA